MAVRSIELSTKKIAVGILTALSLLLQIGCPSGATARSSGVRHKQTHHKWKRTKHRRSLRSQVPIALAEPVADDNSQTGITPAITPQPLTTVPAEDTALSSVLKNVSEAIHKQSDTFVPAENEQIVVGLARQILDKAIQQLSTSGQSSAGTSTSTKVWNSSDVRLSERFHGSVATAWRQTNDGLLTVTITGECSDNTVIDGKKIGEFIVSVEARSATDSVDAKRWTASVSKISVDADCCRVTASRDSQKKGISEKRTSDEKTAKKESSTDSFFEYEKPSKSKPKVTAKEEPKSATETTPIVVGDKDTTTVEPPVKDVPETAGTSVPPAKIESSAQTAKVDSAPSEDRILTSFRRNQYLDVRAFKEQQKSMPTVEVPWTDKTSAGKKEKDKIKKKRSSDVERVDEVATVAEQPEIQRFGKDEDDPYGANFADDEILAKKGDKKKEKIEKAEKKEKKPKAKDDEGSFIDKAIEGQEKEALKEQKEAQKEQTKAEKKKARQSKSDEPRKTSIEELFEQDLAVGDDFLDTKKVERMERMARSMGKKGKGSKGGKEPARDKTDDLLAQALAEEQGEPIDSLQSKDADEGIPDTFAAKNDRNSAPRKLFDRLDPDEEITPSEPAVKKPELSVQDRIKRASRPEGFDTPSPGMASADTRSDTIASSSFSGISLRDHIPDQTGSPNTGSGGNESGITSSDPIALRDGGVATPPQAAPESGIEGWNRVQPPDNTPGYGAENFPDQLIARSAAKVRGKGGSIASKLFAAESAFSPDTTFLSSRPLFNPNPAVTSTLNTTSTIFDGNAATSPSKRPGLDAIIVLPDRAIAGENITVAVIEKKQPEHAIELNFNGAPLATDGKGQAQYLVPEDATPGKTLLVSVTGRPELRCIEVIQPLATSSDRKATIDNISKLVASGSVLTINGHNFAGVAQDNKVTIDNRDADVIAASPLQLKVSLPADLAPGTHTASLKNDSTNQDNFEYISVDVRAESARRLSNLIVKVAGTTHPIHVRLINRTPDLIQISQGDNVLVTTSGGKYNTCTVAVKQLKQGDYKIDAAIEI